MSAVDEDRQHLQVMEPPDDTYGDALSGPAPTHNTPAEQALLGAILATPEIAPAVIDDLDADDFHRTEHETIWTAIAALVGEDRTADPAHILEHLQRSGDLTRIGGGNYLHTLYARSPGTTSPEQAHDYTRIILDASRLRRLGQVAVRLTQQARSGRADTIDDTLAQALDDLDQAVARVGASHLRRPRHIDTIDELLAGYAEDDTYDWVIPDILERQDRLILTAEEGAGKSTLMRQIGVQAASGIHPFSGEPTDPITVLHIDVENTRRQSRRRYRPLRIQAGRRLDPARLRVEIAVAGIDLTTQADRDWLLHTCATVRPDLLLIGPVYKLANGDPTEEKSAKPVAMALDQVRDQSDCAVILEAHAAKAPAGQKRRPHEPYGWSGWLRWPELGLWLDKDGSLIPWRGAREERAWPNALNRGGEWPWQPGTNESEATWRAIRNVIEGAGRMLSNREVARQTGLSEATVRRITGAYAQHYQALRWRMEQTSGGDNE